MEFDKEFKAALHNLPDVEKDKLILKLLRNNIPLAERMYFEMVDTETVEDKRAIVEKKLIKNIKLATDNYYSPGLYLMSLRFISGDISHHVKLTKDKYGEISLNLILIRQALEQNNTRIQLASYKNAYTLGIYIIGRVFKILVLMQKFHNDIHLEFRRDIEAIGREIGKNDNLMRLAINNTLDVNWLTQFEIPENIATIHKNLRENGLLV